ncbi:cytochrome P450 [Aspergillus heterothallicus]
MAQNFLASTETRVHVGQSTYQAGYCRFKWEGDPRHRGRQRDKVILASLTILFCAVVGLRFRLQQRQRLPPGPRPLPIIGNMHQIPATAPWANLRQWAKQYGPIITVRQGSRTIILVSTRKVARDLLEMRAATYSSRPRLIAGVLHPRVANACAGVTSIGGSYLAFDLLSADRTPEEHLFMYTYKIFATLIFGAEVGSISRQDVEFARTLSHQLMSLLCIENVLLDLFPILEYVPGVACSSRRKGKIFYDTMSRYFADKIEAALASPSWNLT